VNNLSRSELVVANNILEGISNKEIADKLFVDERTIKFHITNIYKKTFCESRSQFLAKFLNNKHLLQGEVMETVLPIKSNPQSLVTPIKNEIDQRDKINFIDEKFKVGKSIDQLHTMMIEVTKQEMTASNVNAACNCVSRINETINTAIQAARFLSGR